MIAFNCSSKTQHAVAEGEFIWVKRDSEQGEILIDHTGNRSMRTISNPYDKHHSKTCSCMTCICSRHPVLKSYLKSNIQSCASVTKEVLRPKEERTNCPFSCHSLPALNHVNHPAFGIRTMPMGGRKKHNGSSELEVGPLRLACPVWGAFFTIYTYYNTSNLQEDCGVNLQHQHSIKNSTSSKFE